MLLTRIRMYACVNIFPIISHSNTYPLKHLHVYNSLTSSCSSTTKAEKHLPPQISLSLRQCWKSNLHLSSGPSESTVTNHKQTKASRNRLYEALLLGTAANFKNTVLVSPRETDENKNDIKGSSQFLVQIKGDEFLAALNARLSPGIEIDIN